MYTVSEMSPGKSWGGRHFLFASFPKREVYMVLYSQVNFFGVILRPRRGCRQKKKRNKGENVSIYVLFDRPVLRSTDWIMA